MIETLQGMTCRRSAEVSDLVAAAIGTCAALALHGLTRWQLVLRRAHADPRT